MEAVSPGSRADTHLHVSADPIQGDDSVLVFLDECYEPFVASVAVVVEPHEAERLNNEISAAFERLKSSQHLRGLASFDDFRRKGFHAAGDPPEIRTNFVTLLAEVATFKSFIVYSDGSTRPDLSSKQRLMIVIDRLVRDVLRAYRSRSRVVFVFESAQSLDPYVERVVRRVVASLGDYFPQVDVRFGAKRQPDLLAVPDYVLHIFSRWIFGAPPSGPELNANDYRSRALRAILGSISVARSLESADVFRRNFGQT